MESNKKCIQKVKQENLNIQQFQTLQKNQHKKLKLVTYIKQLMLTRIKKPLMVKLNLNKDVKTKL